MRPGAERALGAGNYRTSVDKQREVRDLFRSSIVIDNDLGDGELRRDIVVGDCARLNVARIQRDRTIGGAVAPDRRRVVGISRLADRVRPGAEGALGAGNYRTSVDKQREVRDLFRSAIVVDDDLGDGELGRDIVVGDCARLNVARIQRDRTIGGAVAPDRRRVVGINRLADRVRPGAERAFGAGNYRTSVDKQREVRDLFRSAIVVDDDLGDGELRSDIVVGDRAGLDVAWIQRDRTIGGAVAPDRGRIAGISPR